MDKIINGIENRSYRLTKKHILLLVKIMQQSETLAKFIEKDLESRPGCVNQFYCLIEEAEALFSDK